MFAAVLMLRILNLATLTLTYYAKKEQTNAQQKYFQMHHHLKIRKANLVNYQISPNNSSQLGSPARELREVYNFKEDFNRGSRKQLEECRVYFKKSNL